MPRKSSCTLVDTYYFVMLTYLTNAFYFHAIKVKLKITYIYLFKWVNAQANSSISKQPDKDRTEKYYLHADSILYSLSSLCQPMLHSDKDVKDNEK